MAATTIVLVGMEEDDGGASSYGGNMKWIEGQDRGGPGTRCDTGDLGRVGWIRWERRVEV